METPSSQLNTERKSVYCYGNKNAYHEWKLAAFDLYANLILSDLHSNVSEIVVGGL
jgi:hypothetical protein